MIVGSLAHFLLGLTLGSTQHQRWSCICAKIGEESPDNNQTERSGQCRAQDGGPGAWRGPCSLLAVTQRARRNSDTALACQSVRSKKNVSGRIRIIKCSWSYLKFNPLTWFPILIVLLSELGYSFLEKTKTETGTTGLFICDLWDLQYPGKTLEIQIAFKSWNVKSMNEYCST